MAAVTVRITLLATFTSMTLSVGRTLKVYPELDIEHKTPPVLWHAWFAEPRVSCLEPVPLLTGNRHVMDGIYSIDASPLGQGIDSDGCTEGSAPTSVVMRTSALRVIRPFTDD